MTSENFMRMRVQGFQGSEVNSIVFELSEDHDLPMPAKMLKDYVTGMVELAIDKGAEEILIYLTEMKRLLPRKEKK